MVSQSSGDRFKVIRRNSLRNEVDGSFEELEDFEDRNEPSRSNYWVSHQECILLNGVLTDKAKLPPACFAPPTARAPSPQPAPQDESAIRGVVRRITGAVQPVLTRLAPSHAPHKAEMGGVVTAAQCQTLQDYLSPSVGGQYLLPVACSDLLNKGDEAELAKQYESENAKVYARLKRRNTVMAKEGFPPTMC